MIHKGNPAKWNGKDGPNKRQQQRMSGYKGPSRIRRDIIRQAERWLHKQAKQKELEVLWAHNRSLKLARDIEYHAPKAA